VIEPSSLAENGGLGEGCADDEDLIRGRGPSRLRGRDAGHPRHRVVGFVPWFAVRSTDEGGAMSTEVSSATKSGWVTFAGIMLIVAGGTRIIDGLWALKRDDELESAPQLQELLVFDDNLAAWGWFYLILGIVLIAAGVAVFGRVEWARWVGILFVSISMFLHFAWMYAFPVQALVAVVIDALVLYALAAYGGTDEAY
jgi:hypothetical protein